MANGGGINSPVSSAAPATGGGSQTAQQGGIGSLMSQQGGMGFGGGAPMPGSNAGNAFQQLGASQQQQAPAGANFGVAPFGSNMGVQGGMGLQPQQMQGLGDTAQRQIAFANLSPAQQMQQLGGQGGAGLSGMSAAQLQQLQAFQQMSPADQRQASLANQQANQQMSAQAFQQMQQQIQQQGGGMPGQLGGQPQNVQMRQLQQQQAMPQQYTPEQQQLAYQAAQQHATQFANPQATQGRFGAMPSPTQANLGQMGRGMQEQAKLQQLGARGNLAQQTLQNAPGQMNSPFRALSQGRVV